MSDKPWVPGETKVIWLPEVAHPAQPRAEEIAACIELSLAKDETVTDDLITVLPERTDRYRVRRWRLDENHEITAVTKLPEDDTGAPS